MKNVFSIALILLLNLYTTIGIAKNISDPDVISFVSPMPVIPTNIMAEQTVGPFTYTIQNNVSTSSVGLTIKIIPDNGFVLRQGGDCQSSLGPLETCTIIYEITAPNNIGETFSQKLVVEPVGREGYEIESEITFKVIAPASGTLAYIPRQASSGIYKCDVLTTGELYGCVLSNTTNPNTIKFPFSIAFAQGSQETYAYATNTPAGSTLIAQCTVESNGALEQCMSSTPEDTGSSPSGIAFNTSDQTYGYIADFTANEIYKCTFNQTTGELGSVGNPCVSQTTLNGPRFITMQTIGATTYAYTGYSSVNGAVQKCTINATGDFTGCGNTGSITPANVTSRGVAFSQVAGVNYAYVTYRTSTATGGVYQCTVDLSGNFNSCADTGISFTTPEGITSGIISGTQYVYVVNSQGTGSQSVMQCTVGALGVLSCPTSMATTLSAPFAITLFTPN